MARWLSTSIRECLLKRDINRRVERRRGRLARNFLLTAFGAVDEATQIEIYLS